MPSVAPAFDNPPIRSVFQELLKPNRIKPVPFNWAEADKALADVFRMNRFSPEFTTVLKKRVAHMGAAWDRVFTNLRESAGAARCPDGPPPNDLYTASIK